MTKYSLVVYRDDYREFLEKLQELGVVDITVAAWEPDEVQRGLMGEIEGYRHAVAHLTEVEKARIREAKGVEPVQAAAAVRNHPTSGSAYQAYSLTRTQLEELTGELSKITKEIEDLKHWGAFDAGRIEALRAGGIELHFYSLFIKEYEAGREAWGEKYALEEISRDTLRSYFIIAAPAGEVLEVDAQELKPPAADYRKKEMEAQLLLREIAGQEKIIEGLVPYRADFEKELDRLKSRLQLEQVSAGGRREAEGALILLEGWAPAQQDSAVEKTLEQTGAFYIKERPTPDDDVPVLLKNGRFPRLFELIGGFYSLPRYGTMDLTRYFAPFYMIFFAFCLCDAGYGLMIFLLGLLLRLKGGPKLRTAAGLSMVCGIATVVFGFLANSFFGEKLGDMPAFAPIKGIFFDENSLMILAVGLGVFQILFGMVLKTVNITRQYGFRYVFQTLGWMIVLLTLLGWFLLPKFGVAGFTLKSVPFWIAMGLGSFMMLFLNSPGKNPLVNFGNGLWNTYNDITGTLSDVLSYIRLFAIGLSGGILAGVFNDLAMGLSPDIPVAKQLVALIILLIGHGLTLFMSTLSSFVHPMRLTFVEFYKNAGFEATQRAYTPLKNTAENTN